ncbi:hypothetical protein CAEBREN_20031 [Caenorhabditis brenneri]|uniref:RING-type domain-containing protein n=1 Tax=Caenorhabditis brenneri TaxID=135651 RepID=G0N8Z8_CAEBE|nr:hypothetical protein CAEBREN_20031 [Caenorhabditis brenneri]
MAPKKQKFIFMKKSNGIFKVPIISGSSKKISQESMEIRRLKNELEICKNELKNKTTENTVLRNQCIAFENHCEQLHGIRNQLINEMNEQEKHFADLFDKQKKLIEESNKFCSISKEIGLAKDKHLEVQTKLIDILEKDLNTMDQIQKRHEDAKNQQGKMETTRNGEPFSWQLCDICLEKYSNEECHVPRSLGCGHTVCHGCATKLSVTGGVRCPFDRITTKTKNSESLPKNFSVLQMCI